MIDKYSPEMLDEKPRRKPCGLVVVKPTRIFSAIVDLHDPKKSYFTDELERRLTPISGNQKISFVFWVRICRKSFTISANGSLERAPTAVASVSVVPFRARAVVQTRAGVAAADAIRGDAVNSHGGVFLQVNQSAVEEQRPNAADEAVSVVDRGSDSEVGGQMKSANWAWRLSNFGLQRSVDD